jgi:hypothetical protein
MIKKIFSKLYNCIHPKDVYEINDYKDVNNFVRRFVSKYYIGESRAIFTFNDGNGDEIEITKIIPGPFIINGSLVERSIRVYIWEHKNEINVELKKRYISNQEAVKKFNERSNLERDIKLNKRNK